MNMKIKSFKEFLNEFEVEGEHQEFEKLNPKVTITFKTDITFWNYEDHNIVSNNEVKYSKKYDKPSMWIKKWGDDSSGAMTLLQIMIDDVAKMSGLEPYYITNGSSPEFRGNSIVFRPDFQMEDGKLYSEGNFSSLEKWREKVMELAQKASHFVKDEVFNIGDSMGFEDEYFAYKSGGGKCIQIDNVAIAIDNITIA